MAEAGTAPECSKAEEETLTLVKKTEAFVRDALADNDASHDFAHIERVRNVALHIAKAEGVEDLEVVELAALLHDIGDWKYTGSDTAGADMATEFLRRQGYDEGKLKRVIYIIDNISFSHEISQRKAGVAPVEQPLELKVVQDADRVDAIGAIGIARCCTYGGAKKRVLYDPSVPPLDASTMTMEEYRNNKSSTINHFYEKLLHIKDMMKTKAGKAVAQQRHDFMLAFLDQFKREWAGIVTPPAK